MENPRTESARADDDSELIENLKPTPRFSTSSGTPMAGYRIRIRAGRGLGARQEHPGTQG